MARQRLKAPILLRASGAGADLQHIAVSMGALALVRERLTGVFDLYQVAPITNLQLLLGKYVAYLCFTLTIAAVVLAVLLGVLHVPLLGSPWRLGLVLVLLALASVGLGLLFSLLAGSERQAVQFSMLSLLGMVFFSGFALPLAALRLPATALVALLLATYGVLRSTPTHEFRTPLTSLLGQAQLMEMRASHDNGVSERNRRTAQIIAGPVQRLGQLINARFSLYRLRTATRDFIVVQTREVRSKVDPATRTLQRTRARPPLSFAPHLVRACSAGAQPL